MLCETARSEPVGAVVPGGEVRPGQPIPALCRRGLGLDRSAAAAAPLRLVGIVGRGCEQVTLYYAIELACDAALVDRFGGNLSFVERSQLGAFVPAEIARNLE